MTALDDLRALFAGGPDTAIRTAWHDGLEYWEAPADELRPILAALLDAPTPTPADDDQREALAQAIADGIRTARGTTHWLGDPPTATDYPAADAALAWFAARPAAPTITTEQMVTAMRSVALVESRRRVVDFLAALGIEVRP